MNSLNLLDVRVWAVLAAVLGGLVYLFGVLNTYRAFLHSVPTHEVVESNEFTDIFESEAWATLEIRSARVGARCAHLGSRMAGIAVLVLWMVWAIF